MSEEDMEGAGPGPQPDPVPEPRPAAAPEEPAFVLGGVFLIGCGLCLLLVGGGCATLLVILMIQSHGASSESSMFVISLALAGGGIFAIVQGIRMASGRRGC